MCLACETKTVTLLPGIYRSGGDTVWFVFTIICTYIMADQTALKQVEKCFFFVDCLHLCVVNANQKFKLGGRRTSHGLCVGVTPIVPSWFCSIPDLLSPVVSLW